ncbi:MAG: methyltransferase domain-containing protein [Luteitalea sp.]|nr:methyltransferase domain-containing protein [Luteitalea sp.]
MALFEPHRPAEHDELMGSDAATRALSVTVVENDFVNGVYEKLASVYDFTFGPTLHAGRVQAIQRMDIGRGDQVLEVGVGTGINAGLYPRDCTVTGIDLSSSMLEKARDRIARKGIRNVRLLEMDAADIKFGDCTFDIVYAPYLVSVVPDPVAVAREMSRVCKPGGRIIILNHFRSANPLFASIERTISPFTVHIGFAADLDLPGFLAQAELKPVSIEKVNIPRIWSLVTCIKE